MSEDTVTAWLWALEDVPYALVEHAAKQYMRSGKPFFPKPSDLLRRAAVQQVAPEMLPEAAWAEVRTEVRRVGYNRPPLFKDGKFHDPLAPVFSSPLISEAVAATTWELICTAENETVIKAQFTKTLTALMERAVNRAAEGSAAGPAVALPGNVIPLPDRSVS